MRNLVIGDIHEPVSHPGYLQFCKDLYKQWNCDGVVFIGDIVDHNAISFHASVPECPGPADEFDLTYQAIKKWHKAFPVAKIAIGNHDCRVLRLAESVNVPSKYIRDYNDTWDTDGWDWQYEHMIENVLYLHGTGSSGIHPSWGLITKKMSSVVCGHCHSRAGVKFTTNGTKRFFGMDTGCVDGDTEYLSPTGWEKISSYSGGLVGQYIGGYLEFVVPEEYIKLPADKLNHFETKYGVSQTLCDNHRVVYMDRSKHKKLKEKKMWEIIENHRKGTNGFRGRFITTFKKRGSIPQTDDQLRLSVAFFADGTLGGGYPRILVKKERKKERLEKLLKSTGTNYKRSDYKNGCSSFWFTPPVVEKKYPDSWYNASTKQLRVIADESMLWDGDQKNIFYSNSERCADFIQFAFSGSGRRASISKDRGTYRVIVSRKCTTTGIASSKKVKITKVSPKDGYKYCFKVPSGYLLLRKDKCIFMTGNCGIDVKAWQFSYGRNFPVRPCLAAGIVIDGTHPYSEIMPCSPGEPYHRSKF